MERVVFTEEMKKTHTILVPTMLPIHFNMMVQIMRQHGYKADLLTNDSHAVIDQGLRNVHNDTCYPALLVIGQMIDALESGKYDLHKVALLITQTGAAGPPTTSTCCGKPFKRAGTGISRSSPSRSPGWNPTPALKSPCRWRSSWSTRSSWGTS